MPSVSAAQRRWAFAAKGEQWAKAHHMDTPGKLPARAPAKGKKKRSKREVAALKRFHKAKGD